MTDSEYQKSVKRLSAPSPLGWDLLRAFLFGGGICTLGQVFNMLYTNYTAMDGDNVKACVSMTLIAITAVLTGIGVFDNIAKYAGAGTIVPITGFANSIVSPAIEFNREGRILGTGAKMFTIAGPVIVYGCSAASLYGLIVYIFNL